MLRRDATGVAVELAGSSPIVAGVGNATFDLYAFDRPQNFYTWNSMGMASSIGLGLALARPNERVVILDGDGALLMNLGSLATTGMSGVRNLVHVVWDNGGWDITGGQPAGTTFGVDLPAIARGCGYRQAARVETIDDFGRVFTQAMADDETWLIAARIEPGGSPNRPTKTLVQLRDRFIASLPAQASAMA